MNPKQIHLLIIACFFIVSDEMSSQDYWLPVNSPTMHKLRKLTFIDNLTGWIAGDLGTIIHTTDGGDNWEFQNSGVSTNLIDIFFLNKNIGWALTWNLLNPAGTVILNTNDGGETWTAENYPEINKFINKIFFVDSLRGWMGGNPNIFVYTTDGGVQWSDVVIDSGELGHLPVSNFSFFDSKNGFACGGIFDVAGVIWKTTNGGINWTAMGVAPEPVEQLAIIDSLHAVGTGGDFEFGTGVVRTHDGGESWEHDLLNVFGIALAVSFRTSSEGWASLGSMLNFLVTRDSGKTWMPRISPDSSTILDLQFSDSLHGYAVGDSGRIYKFNSSLVQIKDEFFSQSLPSENRLLQNYPNPFNPLTNIPFKIDHSGIVQLSIFDLAGRQIVQLIDKKLPAGTHEINWDGSAYSSGIYLCRLRFGKLAETKKMILLK